MLPGRLARESKSHFPVIVVDNQIVPVGLAFEVSVDQLRDQQLLTLRTFLQLFIDRSDLIAYQGLILFNRRLALFELPLTFEQRRLVYKGKHIVELYIVNNTRTVKRRRGNWYVRIHGGTNRVSRVTRLHAAWSRAFPNTKLRFFPNQVFNIFSNFQRCSIAANRGCCLPITADKLVHRVQAGKRITRIVQLTVIERFQIVLDVTARQCRTSEHDRNFDTSLVHQFEVLFHDQRRLHEQAAHSNRIRGMFVTRLQNRLDRLLDAEIQYLVAVVGENDVDQVLADIVNVALDGRKHHRSLGSRAALLLHKRFEEANGSLHSLRRLQHERQLHLAAAEKISDDLHTLEQDVVDDVERRVFLEAEF